MEMNETMLVRNDIYAGKIINVHVDDIEQANGRKSKRECVDHPGGVCVAAVTDNNELLFVRQFRYPYHKILLELPAGKLEKGEDPFDAIQRELREETGCVGRDWVFCGEMYPTPGYCNEIIRLWTCKIEKDLGELDLDEGEFIEVEKIHIDKAVEMVMNNEIPDGKTQILILKTAAILKQA